MLKGAHIKGGAEGRESKQTQWITDASPSHSLGNRRKGIWERELCEPRGSGVDKVQAKQGTICFFKGEKTGRHFK